jgi:hypothetical protein
MILAFYDDEGGHEERKAAVRAYFKTQHLEEPDQWFSDFCTAFCVAMESVRAEKVKGKEIILVGFAEDVVPPVDVNNQTGDQWGMAGQYLLGKVGVELILLDQPVSSKTIQTIADYQHSLNVLEDEVIKRRKVKVREESRKKGYTGGRPPYGYSSVDGKLVINPNQAEDVKRVFYEVSLGHSISEIAQILKSKHPDQNWDHRCKVSRILAHRELYQDGRYVNSAKGIDVVLPGVAFLEHPSPSLTKP